MPLDKGKGHEGDESSGQKRTSGSQTTAEQFRRQAAQEQERRRIHQQQTFAKMGEKWVQSRQERRRIHQQQTFAKMGERWDQSRRERAPEDPKKEVALRSIGTNEIDLTEQKRESQKLNANIYHAQE